MEDEDSDDPFGAQPQGQNGLGDDEENSDEGQQDIDNPEDADMDAGGFEDDDGDIDSGEALAEGDEDKFRAKSVTFRGSGSNANGERRNDHAPAGELEDDELSDSDDENADDMSNDTAHPEVNVIERDDSGQESGAEDDEDVNESESDSVGENHESNSEEESAHIENRAALRKMMAEEQKSVVATISQAAKADAAKGAAVKQQRSTFDALLNTRIRLQKALVASNLLSSSQQIDKEADDSSMQAAEFAALNLWNWLTSLRQSLQPMTESKKRTFTAMSSTSSAKILAATEELDHSSLPLRRSTLDNWAQKTHSVTSISTRNKLSNSNSQQPLTSILDAHLSADKMETLVKRTQIPRSCNPASGQPNLHEEDYIFDDTDFYRLLLRELVDQKMATSNSTATNHAAANGNGISIVDITSLTREAKVRKKVDTKASKGRKLRYTVHEKLQNFMAAEDHGSWEPRQVDELFGSLLGRTVHLAEGRNEDFGVGEDDDGAAEATGLRLFEGT
jgi:protein AATF/BFR2